MRLLCNGVALDLEAGATMSLKKINPLFAFDKLTCERSQSFNLPATPTNDRVLELAKLPAYRGNGMRVRFDAELQDGTVVKQGYLYVDKYGKDKYNAIFVTGDLVGLKRIKDVGSIYDYLVTNAATTWSAPMSASEAAANLPLWAGVAYRELYQGSYNYPSYSLQKVVDMCLASMGVNIPTYPAGAELLRVIPGELKRIDAAVHVTSNPLANSEEGAPINVMQADARYFDLDTMPYHNKVGGTCAYLNGFDEFDRPITARYLYFGDIPAPAVVRTIQCLRARYECDITFGENTPAYMRVMMQGLGVTEYDFGIYLPQPERVEGWGGFGDFNGDRINGWRYNPQYIAPGNLAGTTIHLHAGDKIAFIDTRDFASADVYEWTQGEYREADNQLRNGGQPYEISGQTAYDIDMQVLGEEVVLGGNAYLQPNLPAISLVEALQTIAALYGHVINYTDARGIIFESLQDMGEWPIVSLDRRVLGMDNLERRFADYSQRNIVHFDSSAYVYRGERLQVVYEIANDNIQADSELQVIPFSEGGLARLPFATFAPIVVRNANEQATDKDVISRAGTGDDYLGRVSLELNAAVVDLCDASTSVTLRARMTLQEYEGMTSKTLLLYAGTRYVWTEAQYSKGVVTLKLSKIGA